MASVFSMPSWIHLQGFQTFPPVTPKYIDHLGGEAPSQAGLIPFISTIIYCWEMPGWALCPALMLQPTFPLSLCLGPRCTGFWAFYALSAGMGSLLMTPHSHPSPWQPFREQQLGCPASSWASRTLQPLLPQPVV